jgi:hypothetical protein
VVHISKFIEERKEFERHGRYKDKDNYKSNCSQRKSRGRKWSRTILVVFKIHNSETA